MSLSDIFGLIDQLANGISSGEILNSALALTAFVGVVVSVFLENWQWFKRLTPRRKAVTTFGITITIPVLVGLAMAFRADVFDWQLITNSVFIGITAYCASQVAHGISLPDKLKKPKSELQPELDNPDLVNDDVVVDTE